ncbi:membrane associated DnaJ chaperone-like protein [Microdochium trichocladiopsis]|uniref:Membrane associated DnaJ chaperone-like protein n=1 Tax=Microdochium trichocladiopsis TaxID=1682393 RepID=A0A9P9BMQ6_9PEZI|nr:membrane associated DnaJ chaperone-like protein [Microdochium trichocladiopsis]KAH7026126.1 membrane associated DnaJ chaperone-like protein [Microdochium trichocladiopsis]
MSSSNLLSFVGWSFLPNLITGWVQTIYYGVTIRAGEPKPTPGTPRYNEHRRRIYILVVSCYLLYTVYEADWVLQRAGTFYSDLGVPVDASEKEIKSRFRRLAAMHHPDKLGPDAGSDSGDFFMQLKTASEVLTDPAKRFAYERFGPEMLKWQHCTTIRDYIMRGAQALIPYYLLAAIVMYGMGMMGYLEWGKYWRWLTIVVLCVFELHTVTRPAYPRLVAAVINPLLTRFTHHGPYLPFQLITLARKLSVTFYIALSQIGPLVLRGGNNASGKGGTAASTGDTSEKVLRQTLDRIEQAAQTLDADASRLMELEMAPFAGDPALVNSMRGKLREWLVQNTIRSDPMVKDALGRSFQKRRADAPAGAKGTR